MSLYVHELDLQKVLDPKTHHPPAEFDLPDPRYENIHIDIVGPLPKFYGFSYLFTYVEPTTVQCTEARVLITG